jgi:integrase
MTRRSLPPYVYRKGRAGYLYFCRGGATIRMHAAPGTAAFAAEYAVLMQGRAPVPAGRSFAALIASYRRSQRFAKLKPRTRADYDKVLTFIEDRIGAEDATKLRRHHVIRYRDDNAGAVRFANYLVQILRILMEHAFDSGWRADNPAKGVPLLKSTTGPRLPWPPALVEAFRATATGPALLILELCLGTGQRIGDVLRMRWNDLADGGVNVRQGKTGTALWIPLTARLRTAIDATPKRGLTIVTNPDGRPMAYKTAQGHVMKVRAQIAMVLNLDKCIGCHTCSVTCKQVWTTREGVEYAWFNNVETKPGIGYPKDWENQDKWKGGWKRNRRGTIQPRIGAKWRILANIFANPTLPEIDDYYEPFTFDYDGNVQGGRTAATEAAVTVVAGRPGYAKPVVATGTITRSKGISISLVAEQDRGYIT